MDLSVSTREQDGRMIVEVGGEIDVYSAPTLRDQLNGLVAAGHHHLIVDMQGVEFLDSTGLGVLVGVWHRLGARRGSLALAAPSRQIQRILATTGLTKMLAVYDHEADAVQACRQPAGPFAPRVGG